MSGNIWDDEYQSLLRLARENGELAEGGAESERRVHPRFNLRMESVWMKMDAPLSVTDISLTGIALLSSKPFMPGAVLQLQVGKAFHIEATVVGCEMEETDPALLDMSYRLRCRFAEGFDTKQILVLIKEMDLQYENN